jgi:hypothetical protein
MSGGVAGTIGLRSVLRQTVIDQRRLPFFISPTISKFGIRCFVGNCKR